MKINKIYIVLAFLGVALSLGACSDEWDEFGSYKKNTGDEIVFSGRAGFEMDGKSAKAATTRTVYTGTTYTEGGKTFERVNWVKGDQIRVYCPEAAMMKAADYTVTAQNTGVVDTKNNYHATTLERVGDASLQWGGKGEHNFYAVYPSPLQYVGQGVSEAEVLKNSSVVKGVIPSTQVHIHADGIPVSGTPYDNTDFKNAHKNNTYMKDAISAMSSRHYVVQPNMKYAYMVARTQVSSPDNMGDVFLDFMPIATAVEITLRNLAWKENVSKGQTFNLTSVVVSSRSGNILSGCFTADLNTMDGLVLNAMGNGRATGYPTSVKLDETKPKSSTVSIPMYSHGTNGSPLELAFGDAVTFTVFVSPTADINDLNITINGLQGSRTGTLTGITVEKHKKTYLKSVPITGDVLPFDFANWLRWVDDEVLVRSLSIPGSGGSATYHLENDGTVDGNTVKADMVRQQNYSIQEQWNAGIRCFEFSVDLNGTDENNSLGNSKVICSGLELDYTLSQAVDEVKKLLLKNYHEFAAVIVTYDTKGGWYTKSGNKTYTSTRNPELFMKQLNNYWTSVAGDNAWKAKNESLEVIGSPITTGTALYNPANVTVGNSRGKMFCIARPTSLNVDYGDYVLEDPILHVTGVAEDGQYKWEQLNNKTEGPELLARNGMKQVTRPELPVHNHILLIHGWGTDKDKWGQRGFSHFSVRRTKCNEQSLWGSFSFTNSRYSLEWLHTVTTLPAGTVVTAGGATYTLTVEKDGRMGRPFDTSKFTRETGNGNSTLRYNNNTYYGSPAVSDHYAYDPVALKSTVDFTYETSAGTNAWVQEWARVSKENQVYHFKSTGTKDLVYQVYWTGSYAEKLLRVKETLEYAQNKTKGDIVYINSLSGYFITNDYFQSIQPCSNTDASVFHLWGGQIATPSSTSTTSGMGGDIAGFAKQINADFYNHLLGVNTDYEAGSMGIVLIDRVGDDDGKYIPGVIIANNFQFDLESGTNPAFSLYDEENEEAQFAPARRGAEDSDEEEVTFTWE